MMNDDKSVHTMCVTTQLKLIQGGVSGKVTIIRVMSLGIVFRLRSYLFTRTDSRSLVSSKDESRSSFREYHCDAC